MRCRRRQLREFSLSPCQRWLIQPATKLICPAENSGGDSPRVTYNWNHIPGRDDLSWEWQIPRPAEGGGGSLSEPFLFPPSRRSPSSPGAGCSAADGDLRRLRQQVSDRQFAANLFAGLNLVPALRTAVAPGSQLNWDVLLKEALEDSGCAGVKGL